MEQRTLGRSGLQVSALGFGCGNIGGLMVRGEPAARRAAVARAIAAGVTYFDTAAQYGQGQSEENLGRALRELDADVRVGTKIRLPPDTTAADAPAVLRRELEAGLRRLGRDAVDVCHLHNAISDADARGVKLDDLLGPVYDGLRALRDAGLTRAVGITGLGDPALVQRAVVSGAFDTVQAYFNVLYPSAGYPGTADDAAGRFDGLLDQAAARAMGVLAIRILAAGAVTANPARHPLAGDPSAALVAGSEYDRDLARAAALPALAAELGLEGPVELSLRFVLAHPHVSTALVGFSDEAQLADALRWAERGPLAPDAVAHVLAALHPPAS
jgi:L-galactose dehydrogenase/L-glyceraldehyde 3-phosphate reductase